MPNASYGKAKILSSTISDLLVGKSSVGSGRLGEPMRKRQPVSDILDQKMKELGIKTPDIVRVSTAKGNPAPKSTIRSILDGDVPNPGIFTLESIALGMNMSPEQLAADILGSRADDPAFKGSQFAILLEMYKSMSPAQRERADPHIAGLLLQFQHIRNHSK